MPRLNINSRDFAARPFFTRTNLRPCNVNRLGLSSVLPQDSFAVHQASLGEDIPYSDLFQGMRGL